MGNIAIIGAGLSGLVTARTLQSSGHEVVVYEKSRSLAGRCATRKWSEHIVDHGAQYFTISSELFREELKVLPSDQIATIVGNVVGDDGQALSATGGKRYYYRSGNNRMGKALAHGLDVRLDQTIDRVIPEKHRWCVAEQTFDAIVVTAPWPQTNVLLEASQESPKYVPCLTVFFEFEGNPAGKSCDYYAMSLRNPKEPLAWSACENHKAGRISGDKTVFVVQASEAFSRAQLEEAPEAYTPELLARLQQLWDISATPTAVFNHRWRYARKADESTLPQLEQGLFVAGDSCVESKIESVWLDGKRAAQDVENYLNSR